jgi:hypothetical protein
MSSMSDGDAIRPPATERGTGTRSAPRTGKTVTVVRPYGPRIRERMFQLLTDAGARVGAESVVPAGTSDEEAVAAVIRLAHPILLVPFHGQRDASGRATDGLKLLRMLRQELGGAFPWRVLMPVSNVARAALTLEFASGQVPSDIEQATLVIDEADLSSPTLADRIRSHIHG